MNQYHIVKKKERNQGFIHKFNNAIGSKDVVGYYDNWNCYVRPKVSSPKKYITPERALFDGLRADFDGKYILTFILEDKYVEHPSKKYSYHTRDIAKKLDKFASKVFPEIEVMVEFMEENEKSSEKDFVLEKFILGISNDINYTLVLSISEKLSQEDIDDIVKVLKSIVDTNISIEQKYCDTCAMLSDGEYPWHIEIKYND